MYVVSDPEPMIMLPKDVFGNDKIRLQTTLDVPSEVAHEEITEYGLMLAGAGPMPGVGVHWENRAYVCF